MKIKFLLTVAYAAILLISSCNKEDIYPNEIKKEFETNFCSKFELTVALPQGYHLGKKYKAIFLLDAEWMLKECTEALSKQFSNTDYIIFGLSYKGSNNRVNDFTPTKTEEGTGKAKELKQFIEYTIFNEYIANEFPNIDTSKNNTIFIGHSLGGLFGTYLFVNNSSVFGKYLLISSTLTYDSQIIFGLEIANRANSISQHAKIYFGTGSQEEHGFHSSLQHLTRLITDHYPGVIYKSETFKNTEHVGARKKALENGLPYLITE